MAKESKVKIQVKHDSPALLSEWYPVKIQIQNDDSFRVCHPTLDVRLQAGSDDAVEQSSKWGFIS